MPARIKRTRIPWRDRPYVSVQEAADLLYCSQSQVYILAETGKLGSIRLNGKIGIKTADILTMLGEAPAPRKKAG